MVAILTSPNKAQSSPEEQGSSIKTRHHANDPPRNARTVLKQASQRCVRPHDRKKVPVTARHEILMLRAQAALMEKKLHDLQTKWKNECPDELILTSAYRSLHEKYATNLSEKTQRKLQQLLRQQQIMFAALQKTIQCAPLHSSGNKIFEALHFHTLLGWEAEEREKMLLAHKERSLATIPFIVDRFSQMAIEKARSQQRKDYGGKSFLPFSQLDITGCKDCTLISSVFVMDIPHTSMEDVFAAALAYFGAIPEAMKKHCGITAKRERLNSADSPVVYRCTTFTGSALNHTVNSIMCSELTASHGMVHVDAVTEDLLHPVPASATHLYGICGLHVTPRKDYGTGRTVSVMLQWIVVYHFNMLPHDPAIRHGVEILRPILNGDLLTASICEYIQQQQQQQQILK